MPTPVTLYRVSYHTNEMGHTGYTWHTSKREAQKAAHEADNVEYEDPGYGEPIGPSKDDRSEVEKTKVPRTKEGLVSFLNVYAGHPNNG